MWEVFLMRLICVYVRIHVCMCVCVCTICMYACMYVGGESWRGGLWTRAREFGTRVCKQGPLYIFIHTHLLTYIHSYIHTFIYSYIHLTYIHTYIHSYLIYISLFFSFKSLRCWFNSASRPPTLRAESNVCMYVCINVCMFVCIYVCMYVCVCVYCMYAPSLR